jgi:hypothetical protein
VRVPTTTYELGWPRALDEKAVHACLRAFAADNASGPLVLDVIGEGGTIRHFLTARSAVAPALARKLGTLLPGVRAEEVERDLPSARHALRLKLSSRRRPLRSDNAADTATAILTALSETRRGESLHLQWCLGPRLRPVAVRNNFSDFNSTNTGAALLTAVVTPPAHVDPEQRSAQRDKQGVSGWRAVGRLGVRAGSAARERQLLSGLLAALRVTESPGLRLDARGARANGLATQKLPRRWPIVLNERELVGLTAWPLGDRALPGVTRTAYTLRAADETVPQRGRIVGDVAYPGSTRAMALNGTDAARHCLILGPTGVGKSTLMGQLALADAADGRGVILIDNRRDLALDFIARLPEDRLDDLVVIDPSSTGSVVGFNPLAGAPEEAPLLADRLVNIFRQIYGDNLGPRTEDILHAGLLTLALYGGQTLPMLPLLFTNPAYRRRLTATLSDPLGLGSFWTWFEGISEAERRAATAPLMNKLRTVLLRPTLRRALGQAQPHFSVRQVFTERRILLVNLAKGDLGPETAQLFGALLLNEIWQQTLARATVPADRRHLVMLHVDEFHEYLRLPTPLADVLVAARGYGLGLSIAAQHLDQLTPNVRAAVLGNAGSRVVFRLSDSDARTLARDSVSLTPEDFRGLGAYEAYASLMAHGARTPYASIRTRAFAPPLREAGVVRQRALERWGVPGAQIDEALRTAAAGAETMPTGALGRRPRTKEAP